MTEQEIITNLLTNESFVFESKYFEETPLIAAVLAQKEKLKELEKENIKLQKELSNYRSNKYVTPKYTYKNEEILCPPVYKPSENELVVAKAKYVFENVLWSIIYYTTEYFKIVEGESNKNEMKKEMIKKEVERYIEKWNKGMEVWSDDVEFWDAFLPQDWFQRAFIDSLSDTHMGDCTGFPSTCMRCHAEELFNIPNTATWSGKSEGYRLHDEYVKDYQEKNKEKASERKDE